MPTRPLAGIALVGGMWLYAAMVLWPARLRALGRAPALPHGGLGARFSLYHDGPVRSASVDARYTAFDAVAQDYEHCVGPFASPIFAAALRAIGPHLPRRARVLDIGCGTGAALRRVARAVPDGEVVGVDASYEMLRLAHGHARRERLTNVALVHADAAALPATFRASFDLAYSCLVHHHFDRPLDAVRGVAAALRPGGVYAAVDATGPLLTTLATPFARAVDPGWVRFWRTDALCALLAEAGLTEVRWVRLTPGIGMAVGVRP